MAEPRPIPMPIEILRTLGPASMNDRVVGRLEEFGFTLFRFGLSHIALADLPAAVRRPHDLTRGFVPERGE